LDGLVEHFATLSDPGVNRTKDHHLVDVLIIVSVTRSAY
jgi:hypothetical protein